MSAGVTHSGSGRHERWPTVAEYNEAVQNLATCLGDDELRRGIATPGPLGVPMPYSGAFADVYKIECPATGNVWAVKFFKREVRDLRGRYREISDHLARARLPFMVDFQYQDEGVRVAGVWRPVVKLRWVEGLALNQFVAQSLEQPRMLDQLAQLWIRLAARLREGQVAHGDLQHGNILLVPRGADGHMLLKLIDYDGMWVPGLASQPSAESGHRHFQHPQRFREGIYSEDVDRFSHLAILTALRCARVGGTALWERCNNDDNLLFQDRDFADPASSALLREMWSLRDSKARTLVGHLVVAAQRPLDGCPWIDELVADDGDVRPLTLDERSVVASLLGEGRATARSIRESREAAAKVAVERSVRADEAPPMVNGGAAIVDDAGIVSASLVEETSCACWSCGQLLEPPDFAPRMPVSLISTRRLLSSWITIERHRALLMIEYEIREAQTEWPFPQPAAYFPRSSVVGLGMGVLGCALLVALLLILLDAAVWGTAVAIVGGLTSLALWQWWRPRELSALEIAWDQVIPRFWNESPPPSFLAFLAGLAHVSVLYPAAARPDQVQAAARSCRALYQNRRITYPLVAALERLQLVQQLHHDPGQASELLLELLGRWWRDELPLEAIDQATAQGTMLDLWPGRERTELHGRFLWMVADWGFAPSDLMAWAARSPTLDRLLNAPDPLTAGGAALVLAAARLPPDLLKSLGAWSMFHSGSQGYLPPGDATTRYVMWTTDHELMITRHGLFFRGYRLGADSHWTVDSIKTFVRTGWTYQRRDGGPDLRFKDNPPLGYEQITGYVLTIDGQSKFQFAADPAPYVRRLEEWHELCFAKLSPLVDDLLARPPLDLSHLQLSSQEVRCRHCGTRQIYRQGSTGQTR